MKRTTLGVISLIVSMAGANHVGAQSPVHVRIMPPNQARFLQYQQFDVRVEVTAPVATEVGDLRVTLDGKDITSHGTITSPAPNVRNWTLRRVHLGTPGGRVLEATAPVRGSDGLGTARSHIQIHAWRNARPAGLDRSTSASLDAMSNHRRVAPSASESSRSRRRGTRAINAARPRARNVILLIGDGMGIAHRTAARVLSKGYTQGKANGLLAMDGLPFNGMLMTSSLDSLITDSGPGAHCYSTGNKTNNGMEGVFPDNTEAEDDNPRIENLSEWAYRTFGMVTGVVSDAYITDATPAAMIAHVQNRDRGSMIAEQYIDEENSTGLKVLLGGGARDFLPMSQTGSSRPDERNVIEDFKHAGFDLVKDRRELNGYASKPGKKLLGLFHPGNMNVAFDKLRLGDPGVVAAFPDQPFLDEMTRGAINVLRQYPNGFFLMVEGAHIDKQSHHMDAERSIYDVIQFDHAVQVALDFARRTNNDSDPDNDTLIVVSADHECAGVALSGVGNPKHTASARDYVKTGGYSAPRNDPTIVNFTNYVDANGDGYPDNPDTDRKLIVSFGANSDRFEDWRSSPRPKMPGALVSGVAVANPVDPDHHTGMMINGIIENGEEGGHAHTLAVHTLSDIPVSAYGPGASQFARVSDNTQAFFYIVNAIVGEYADPSFQSLP